MKISKYLKVAFFVYLFSLLIVACRPAPHKFDMDTISAPRFRHRGHLANIDWSMVTVSYVRWMEIYNSCSQQRLQITSRRSVNAYGHTNSSYTRLRVETLKLGSEVLGIRISSGLYNTYLCFNKRGKLTGKFKGSSLNCVFREKLSWDHYSQYQSLYNRSWFVGFNRKGKPLAGKEKINTRRPRCFKFVNFHERSIVPMDDSKEFSPFSAEVLERILPEKRYPKIDFRPKTKRLKAKNGKRQSKKFRHRNKKRTHRRRNRKPPR